MGQAGENPALTRNRYSFRDAGRLGWQAGKPASERLLCQSVVECGPESPRRAGSSQRPDMVSDREEGTMSTVRRAPIRVLLAAVVAACLSALTLAPAQAAAYRYWGFFQLTGTTWAYAQKGPDQTVPKDGAVEGWRFAVADESSTRFPRAVLTFDQLCGTTPAQAGKKRVGLVLDFGRPADAADGATPPQPKASCAVVATDATSSAVLATAGEVRAEKGLVCAIAGYPATDCGGAVKEVSPEAKAKDQPISIAAPAASASPSAAPSASDVATSSTSSTSGGSVAAYVIGGLLLLALVGYLLVRSRARRNA